MPSHEAMDLQTVADLLGVSTRQVNNYIRISDLPSRGEGRSRTFVWAEVREWFVSYRIALEMRDGSGGSDDPEIDAPTSGKGRGKEDIRAANLRKTRADADLKELALSRERAEVIAIADARERVGRLFGNLRTKLLGLPPKLANRLQGIKSRTEQEAAIAEEMTTLCRELSTGEIVGLADNPDAPDASEDAAQPDTLDTLAAAAETEPVFTDAIFGFDHAAFEDDEAP